MHIYATAKLGHLLALFHPPPRVVAASLYVHFRACVPEVGVGSGRRAVVCGDIENGATQPARVRRAFVSQNQALARNLAKHHP